MSGTCVRMLRTGICGGALVGAGAYLALAQDQPQPGGASAEAAVARKAPPGSAEKIERALESTIVGTWDFTDTPLTEVVNQLREDHGIEIQLDAKSLEDGGIDAATTTFTRHLAELSLSDALDLLLSQHELSYVVKNSVLLITTNSAAEEIVDPRVYNVGDLIDGEDDYEKLIEILTMTVQPDSWDQNGGAGSVVDHAKLQALVILQTRPTHAKIEKLLDALRETKKVTAARKANRG